ncbi:MAG: O-antigen ligase family protein [Bacillota bacterium]
MKKKSAIKVNKGLKLKYTEYALLAGLCMLLMTSQLMRGLFFRDNYILAVIFTGIMGLLFCYLSSRYKSLEVFTNPISIGLMGLVSAYSISGLNGLSPLDSLDGILKQTAILAVFAVSFYIGRNKSFRKVYAYTLVFTGSMLAAISLLNAAGFIYFDGVITKAERLGGTYQYANTNAAVMGGLMLSAAIFFTGKQSFIRRMAYAASVLLTSWAFWASESRGALIAAVAVWFTYILFCDYAYKLKIFFSGIWFIGWGVLLYTLLNAADNRIGLGLFCILIAAASAAAAAVFEKLDNIWNHLSQRNTKITLTALLAVFLLFAAAALNLTAVLELNKQNPVESYNIYNIKQSEKYIMELELDSMDRGNADLTVDIRSINAANAETPLTFSLVETKHAGVRKMRFSSIEDTAYLRLEIRKGEAVDTVRVKSCKLLSAASGKVLENIKLKYMLLPDSIAGRLTDISLKTGTFAERAAFMKDGLRVLGDNLLLGTGAGGWRYIYTRYQSYDYVSAYVHNHYLQTALETGLAGIIFLGVAIAGISVIIYRTVLGAGKPDLQLNGLAVFAVVILLHSFIDFNLSILAVAFLLWSALGIISGAYEAEAALGKSRKFGKPAWIVYTALTAAALVISLMLYSGISYGIMGETELQSDPAAAKKYFKTAMKRDFRNSFNILRYSDILVMEANASQSRELIGKAKECYEKALKLDPYNTNNFQAVINFYMQYGFYKEASRLVDRLIEIQPLFASNYELKSEINSFIYEQLIQQGNNSDAEYYAVKVLEIVSEYNAVFERTGFKLTLSDLTIENINRIKESEK